MSDPLTPLTLSLTSKHHRGSPLWGTQFSIHRFWGKESSCRLQSSQALPPCLSHTPSPGCSAPCLSKSPGLSRTPTHPHTQVHPGPWAPALLPLPTQALPGTQPQALEKVLRAAFQGLFSRAHLLLSSPPYSLGQVPPSTPGTWADCAPADGKPCTLLLPGPTEIPSPVTTQMGAQPLPAGWGSQESQREAKGGFPGSRHPARTGLRLLHGDHTATWFSVGSANESASWLTKCVCISWDHDLWVHLTRTHEHAHSHTHTVQRRWGVRNVHPVPMQEVCHLVMLSRCQWLTLTPKPLVS